MHCDDCELLSLTAMDLLGVTVFFYALGFEMCKWLFHVKGIHSWYFIVVLLVFIGLHYFFTITITDPHVLNLYLRKYDNFIVNSLEAVSGILLVVLLSISLVQYSAMLTMIFSYVGRCSLTIFIFHELFMPYIGHAGKLFLRADSFSLFALSIVLTIALTLILHEVIVRLPIAGFLLLNQRTKAT